MSWELAGSWSPSSMPAGSEPEAATRTGQPVQGAGRRLVGSAYSDDAGLASDGLRDALRTGVPLEQLASARLLVAVVAVDGGSNMAVDGGSHMALVSMVNQAGAKGLLAFTGVDSLQAWDSAARPVPVPGAQAARAALADGAQALVIDVAGPHRVVVQGERLAALAGLGGEPEEFSARATGC